MHVKVSAENNANIWSMNAFCVKERNIHFPTKSSTVTLAKVLTFRLMQVNRKFTLGIFWYPRGEQEETIRI